MGLKPSKLHTIDRIDNDMGYSNNNCRWATKKEQSINRRSARIITINGTRDSLLGWYNRIKPNISYSLFLKKINTNQSTVENFMTNVV